MLLLRERQSVLMHFFILKAVKKIFLRGFFLCLHIFCLGIIAL